MRKIFFFIAVFLIFTLIFISSVAFSQETTTTDQGSGQTQVTNQEPTQSVEPEEVEEKTEPEEVCAGLKGLDFRRCVIKEKIKAKIGKEFEEVSEKLVEEHAKELKEGIKKDLNIFVIGPAVGPAVRALAAGEIQSVSTNTLAVSTLGFLSQWDISHAKIVKVPGGKGNVSDLEVGQRVKVIGKWNQENHTLVAKVVIVKVPVGEIERKPFEKVPVGEIERKPFEKVEEPKKTPQLPAPVPVILQQILKALQERGIEINPPQR